MGGNGVLTDFRHIPGSRDGVMGMAMKLAGAADAGSSAAENMEVGELLSNAGMTILIGVTVVFSVLILLTVIFYLFGKVMSRTNSSRVPAPAQAPASKPRARAAVPAPTPKPIVEDGIEEEVVAAIAAAIASMEGGRYALRSVRRAAQGGRPAWAMAGLTESTRPF